MVFAKQFIWFNRFLVFECRCRSVGNHIRSSCESAFQFIVQIRECITYALEQGIPENTYGTLIELIASWFQAVTDVLEPCLVEMHDAHVLRTILRTTCYFGRRWSLSAGDVGAVFAKRFGTRATARPLRKGVRSLLG